jgi:platelet-activating factor acetylhydrolase IB subunit alpha
MASLALTERQRSELNQAIFDYLSSQGDKFTETLGPFQREGNLGNDVEVGKGVLEKKWTSVIRLQKKVMELEAKIEQMQHLRGPSGPNGVTPVVNNDSSETLTDAKQLPRPPARSSLTGHRAAITAVVTHPIYSIVASGSEDTTIRIWDSETNQYERTLKGHTGAITYLSFDSKGLFLASCSTDMSAKIWDMNTYACVKTMKGHDHTISCVHFYSNDEQLVTCSRDSTIKFWEVSSGYCTKTFTGHNDWVKTFSISLDGEYLASAGNDQVINIWHISSGNIFQVISFSGSFFFFVLTAGFLGTERT